MNKNVKRKYPPFLSRLKAAFFPKTLTGFTFGIGTQNHAAFMNADMESFAKAGYSENVFVYAAVTQIARRCASIPWIPYRVTDEEKFRRYRALQKAGRTIPRKLKEEVFERDDFSWKSSRFLLSFLDLKTNIT